MKEDFLHYIWQYQAFQADNLSVVDGLPLSITHPGILNQNAGPDFDEAQIYLGGVAWHGPVEIHIKASDWYHHHHDQDTHYDKVVLHVVWHADKPVYRQDGTLIPTLELAGRINTSLQSTYRSLSESLQQIPCSDHLSQVRDITRISMLDKAIMSRMEQKSAWMRQVYDDHTGDWDVVAYQGLARAFGFRVNRDPMWEVSRRLPWKLVLKHQSRLDQLEALLLGTAGFLEEKHHMDPYYQILAKEWKYLAHKYGLTAPTPPLPWRFGKLRPANLPVRRLGQFAALLAKEGRVFAMLREISSLKELTQRLQVAPSLYWQHHYLFGKKAARKSQGLGKSSVHSLIINAVVPLLVAYGHKQDDLKFVEKGLELLQHLPAEDNTIVRRYVGAGLSATSAFDTQGLIGQYEAFCTPRRCLSCPIGVSLLRNGSR